VISNERRAGGAQMSTGVATRPGLLSRIAETLFWTGRYIERADDTARMVDVYVHRMLEEPRADEDAGCGALLAVLGIQPSEGTRLDIGTTLDRLAYDPASPSAIAGAVRAARSGARTVREVISGEMWECLNVTALALPRQRRPLSASARTSTCSSSGNEPRFSSAWRTRR
jgi:uncharacterized alpha-E superfamily protein